MIFPLRETIKYSPPSRRKRISTPGTSCTVATRVNTTAVPAPMASTLRSDGHNVTIALGVSVWS